MKRTLVQFDPATYQRLRQEAFRQTRSMSSLVREFVSEGLAGSRRQRPRRARQLSSVAAGRSTPPPGRAVSERHDEALAEAFRK